MDDVVSEPTGGSQAAPAEAGTALKAAIQKALRELSGLGPGELRMHRRERFRRLGEFTVHGQ